MKYSLDGGVTLITMFDSLGNEIGTEFTADLSNIVSGTHTLNIYATDLLGNTNNLESVSFDYTNYELTSCTPINSPGTYTLMNNVSSTLNSCFEITSDSVTLDGSGFTIDGGVSGGGNPDNQGVVVQKPGNLDANFILLSNRILSIIDKIKFNDENEISNSPIVCTEEISSKTNENEICHKNTGYNKNNYSKNKWP